ncbi:hypothetical protein OAO87_04085 [bacterium]|nr:hypothetical protein [bacterium]
MPRVVDSYIRVLTLIMRRGRREAVLVLLRFDAILQEPLTNFAVAWPRRLPNAALARAATTADVSDVLRLPHDEAPGPVSFDCRHRDAFSLWLIRKHSAMLSGTRHAPRDIRSVIAGDIAHVLPRAHAAQMVAALNASGEARVRGLGSSAHFVVGALVQRGVPGPRPRPIEASSTPHPGPIEASSTPHPGPPRSPIETISSPIQGPSRPHPGHIEACRGARGLKGLHSPVKRARAEHTPLTLVYGGSRPRGSAADSRLPPHHPRAPDA